MVVEPAVVGTRLRGWRIAGTAFAVVVLAVGTVSAASWLARRTEVQDQVYHRPLRQLVLDVGTGDVTLLPGGPAVTVHRHLSWSWSKPVIHEVWDGGTLRITTRCPAVSPGPRCGVDYTLRVPLGAAVTSHTSTGDVNVRGWGGDLALYTSTGNVTGSGLWSDRVEAHTGTGGIDLRFARPPGSVRAGADTGDVRVTVPAGDAYRVRTGTRTGSVLVRVDEDGASARSITVSTGTGDIHVGYG
jgi:hypothetical protein